MTERTASGQDKEMLGELAARLKAGEPWVALELWEAVRRFVEMKARDRARVPGSRAQADDLIQAGFLAMLDTAARYEPGEGKRFLHALAFSLRKAFAAEEGTRSTRRDALQYADSTETAAHRDDPDGPTVGELLPDDGAALAFIGVEYADFLDYCRRVIAAALDTLPPPQGALLRLHYLKGRSLEDTARLCGLSCAQAASDTAARALLRLERGPYRRELRECLEAFEDFREYQEAAKCEAWRRTGISRTEAAALIRPKGG